MKTITNLLELVGNFIDASDEANDRFKDWNTNQYDYVLENLLMLKNTLSINKFFDKNLYIDSDNLNKSHIRLRSGKTMIPNSTDDESFEVNFLQISNGKIYCNFILNTSGGNNTKNIQIEVIDNPLDLDREKIIDIVYKGLQYYKKHSYLFI